MTLKRFLKIRTDDRVLNQLQDNLQRVFDSLADNPLLGAILLEQVPLVAGRINLVAHNLGRKLIGFAVVRPRQSIVVWDTQDANPSPELSLALHSSIDCTIDLIVF